MVSVYWMASGCGAMHMTYKNSKASSRLLLLHAEKRFSQHCPRLPGTARKSAVVLQTYDSRKIQVYLGESSPSTTPLVSELVEAGDNKVGLSKSQSHERSTTRKLAWRGGWCEDGFSSGTGLGRKVNGYLRLQDWPNSLLLEFSLVGGFALFYKRWLK